MRDSGVACPNNLEQLFRTDSCQTLSTSCKTCTLWSARIDPPVTPYTLRSLDAKSLRANIALRHDMNYVTDISFKCEVPEHLEANYQKMSDEYWQALEIELLLRTAEGKQRSSGANQAPYLVEKHEYLRIDGTWQIPCRLPQLLHAIRNLAIGLTHSSTHESLYAMLDVDLLMQQIHHGVSNLAGLVQHLQDMLRQSCVDWNMESGIVCALNNMSKELIQGIAEENVHSMTLGIRRLLQILESMRLERAKIYMAKNREALLNDFVMFEQSVVVDHVEAEDSRGAWYKSNLSPTTSERENFAQFVQALVALVTTSDKRIPGPLMLERHRIQSLRNAFQKAIFHHACLKTFCLMVYRQNPSGGVNASQIKCLVKQIKSIRDDSMLCTTDQRESAAIAIVREAYRACGKPNLPTEDDFLYTLFSLEAYTDKASPFFEKTKARAAQNLTRLVQHEVEALKNLSTAQIARRYEKRHAMGCWGRRAHHCSPVSQVPGEELVCKIAHMATLHWRVWAPIAYCREEPRLSADDDDDESTESEEDESRL